MTRGDVLMRSHGLIQHAPHVYTLGGQGNSLVVDLGGSLLLVDSGPGGDITRRMIQEVRLHLGKPVAHIIYSHGHMGYNNGVDAWRQAAEDNGYAPPQLIAHENVARRFRRYRETAGLQSYTNTRQFRTAYPENPPRHWFTQPDTTYRHTMLVHGADRCVQLLHAPGETDDGTAVWIPESKVLYGSNAFIKTCPNIGSPYRILRDPCVWANTLEKFLDLDPDVLIPEFGKPLVAKEEIAEALSVPAQALRHLRREVVRYMNAGMTVEEIIHTIELPAELFGSPYMKPSYGCAEFVIRDVWRSENGWWNRNPTDLHPSPVRTAANAVLAALTRPEQVLQHVLALQKAGETQLALHVVDLLALADSGTPAVIQARRLKAELCEQRAQELPSFVSRSLLLSAADSLRGQAIGQTQGQKVAFEWV